MDGAAVGASPLAAPPPLPGHERLAGGAVVLLRRPTPCPSCGHANRSVAAFCEACGARLAADCPRCGSEVPPGARYCGACGARLIDSAAPASSLRHAPGAPAEAPEVERRWATVLFADLSGVHSPAQRAGPRGREGGDRRLGPTLQPGGGALRWRGAARGRQRGPGRVRRTRRPRGRPRSRGPGGAGRPRRHARRPCGQPAARPHRRGLGRGAGRGGRGGRTGRAARLRRPRRRRHHGRPPAERRPCRQRAGGRGDLPRHPPRRPLPPPAAGRDEGNGAPLAGVGGAGGGAGPGGEAVGAAP